MENRLVEALAAEGHLGPPGSSITWDRAGLSGTTPAPESPAPEGVRVSGALGRLTRPSVPSQVGRRAVHERGGNRGPRPRPRGALAAGRPWAPRK